MILIKKQYTITVNSKEEDDLINKLTNYTLPWLSVFTTKIYPKEYLADLNDENEQLVTELINKEKAKLCQ
jgi:hypothetical protein